MLNVLEAGRERIHDFTVRTCQQAVLRGVHCERRLIRGGHSLKVYVE